jgi:hypothetical protein
VALTSFFSVELPGIEDANTAPKLHKRAMSRHGLTWENMVEQVNVLTAVSTFIQAPNLLPPTMRSNFCCGRT